MAYIEPNSIVQVFKGINLDNRYIHTIYFASENAQNAWFTGKVLKSYERMSYIRHTASSIKVKDDATFLLGVTYMRFMNSRTKSKWFYAFVLDVEYVNENTAVITYEIDVMQTWFMQGGSIAPCMVLREHTNDDTFGHNLEPEPFVSEIYDRVQIADSDQFVHGVDMALLGYDLVINSTAEPEDPAQTINNNLFNGTSYKTISASSPQAAVASLYDMLGSWDKKEQSAEIIDMFTFPSAFSHKDAEDNIHDVEFNRPTSFDLYVPKNNKLLTYPYSFLAVTTKNGSSAQFRWEYFNNVLNEKPKFDMYGTPLGGGIIICYPHHYNGIYEDVDDAVVMDDFPKNAFSYDAYQAWIASGGKTRLENAESIQSTRNMSRWVQGGMSIAKHGAASLVEAAKSGASAVVLKDPIRATTHGAAAVMEGLSISKEVMDMSADIREARNKISYQWNDASYAPDIPVGRAAPCPSVSLGYLDFYFYHVHLREAEAKHIDDYLSMFGYTTNKVKTPNLTGRRYWNFVQTENCEVRGEMPASSREAIGRIFDGGITLWHNGDQVGNYAQSVSNDSINNPII